MTEPPTPEPPVEEEPSGDEPEYCPSQYPRDPSITCELPAEHNVRMMHRRNLGPDQPSYEWE
ncbi:hypothetical protein ACH40E_33435 [Streptomyces acidicola]|uniref:hypothetical protein n=1 Tax=Streptomyces acidicola TaxID=2596892 RepID=UPI0037AF32D1